MEHILTNDMLLENTRSVARLGPSMFTSSMYFLSRCLNLHRWHPISWWSRRGSHLGGEIFYHFGKCRLYSSPPIWWLSRQAAHWHTLWWQWSHPMGSTLHSLSFPICHMAAIPHPNTLLDHQIIWWTPTIGDLSCPPLSGPVSGLWKLRPQIYNELRTSVIFITDHITKYQQSAAGERHSPILQPPIR